MTSYVRMTAETDEDWTVDIAGTKYHVDGYAAFRRLLDDHPEAEYRIHGDEETALRQADILRAMKAFDTGGRRRWTSDGRNVGGMSHAPSP